MAAIECRWREEYEEVGASFNILSGNALKVPTAESVVVEEDVIAVGGEAGEDGESHADIGAYAFHTNNGGPREGRN